MHMLLGVVLFAQAAGLPAYTLATPDATVLATWNGRYRIELGYGCDDFDVNENVEYLPGSGGVAAIATSGALCNVFIAERLSDDPCATNSDGTCDVSYEVTP